MSDTEAHPEPVPVGGFSDTGEAEVAQAKLTAYGIESFIVDRVEGGVLGEEEGAIALVVRPADAEDARALLAPAEATGGSEATDVTDVTET